MISSFPSPRSLREVLLSKDTKPPSGRADPPSRSVHDSQLHGASLTAGNPRWLTEYWSTAKTGHLGVSNPIRCLIGAPVVPYWCPVEPLESHTHDSRSLDGGCCSCRMLVVPEWCPNGARSVLQGVRVFMVPPRCLSGAFSVLCVTRKLNWSADAAVESCHKVRLSGTTGICGLRQPDFTSTPEYVSTHPKCVMVMS